MSDMPKSQQIVQTASHLFMKLGQNLILQKNLQAEAAKLEAELADLEKQHQAALTHEASDRAHTHHVAHSEVSTATPPPAPSEAASAAPAATSSVPDATGAAS